mmetsp:Transcript_25839/g.39700  ORF Transcript_25839/g.39700 Transcript_25839/m.39700 type:complete len:559 (-) Transcript_25839:169-1845(-)
MPSSVHPSTAVDGAVNDRKNVMILENSRSVAFRDLPDIPTEYRENEKYGTILLFYQYKEPMWTKKEHKKALKKVIELGQENKITGRGRVAPEGLNCTLSGTPQDIRNFCYGLRKWNPLFNETDFKLTDGIPRSKLFKSLSIRKTEELVAYGLAGDDKAPSLEHFAGEHLEAAEYHKAMAEPDTVIVDVRNAYESAIGNFKPPPGGAELIDPKMRNSIEFPKWLNDPRTQEKLNGKKVLMYCTGGIRCERATALLNQMSTVNPNLKPKGVYELRGGIERYIKSYPNGGYWNGKNYLFDRRMEQMPLNGEMVSSGDIEKEQDQNLGPRIATTPHAKCCLCRQPWSIYRGKFKCCQSLCGVPVIVCKSCESKALENPQKLTCELCKEGYRAPEVMPDLVGFKRKAEALVKNQVSDGKNSSNDQEPPSKKKKNHLTTSNSSLPSAKQVCTDRLFLARLPLTVTVTKLGEGFGGKDKIKLVHWLTDKKTGAFYGSCIVEMTSSEAAQQVLDSASSAGGGIKIDKKRIKVSMATVEKRNDSKQEEAWPPTPNFVQKEFPPLGKL